MTDTAINAGLRIALEQVNGALRSHGIEPSGDYGADIERLAANAAPDLLEALEVCVTQLIALCSRDDVPDQAFAALAKAKGHYL